MKPIKQTTAFCSISRSDLRKQVQLYWWSSSQIPWTIFNRIYYPIVRSLLSVFTVLFQITNPLARLSPHKHQHTGSHTLMNDTLDSASSRHLIKTCDQPIVHIYIYMKWTYPQPALLVSRNSVCHMWICNNVCRGNPWFSWHPPLESIIILRLLWLRRRQNQDNIDSKTLDQLIYTQRVVRSRHHLGWIHIQLSDGAWH